MEGQDILEVLREIRDEARQTNARLESLESRVGFLEKRVTKGFESLTATIQGHADRIDLLTRRQTDSELKLASEVLSLADVTREVRDLLSRKLDDHQMVVSHEERIRSLETRIADRPVE